MTIFLKNKHTLQIDDFHFKCSIGKNGLTRKKVEGDKKTPVGTFKIEHLYFRKDRVKLPRMRLKKIDIKANMAWSDDINYADKYNKLIKIDKNINHEKLFRKDHQYDLLIPIKYNFKKRITGKGSCIFLHLTKNYYPTAGCIALKKKRFFDYVKID